MTILKESSTKEVKKEVYTICEAIFNSIEVSMIFWEDYMYDMFLSHLDTFKNNNNIVIDKLPIEAKKKIVLHHICATVWVEKYELKYDADSEDVFKYFLYLITNKNNKND